MKFYISVIVLSILQGVLSQLDPGVPCMQDKAYCGWDIIDNKLHTYEELLSVYCNDTKLSPKQDCQQGPTNYNLGHAAYLCDDGGESVYYLAACGAYSMECKYLYEKGQAPQCLSKKTYTA